MSAVGGSDRPALRGRRLTLGLLVNPVAGLGGPAALKGSDGDDIQARALAGGYEARAAERAAQALSSFSARGDVDWLSIAEPMGGHVLDGLGLKASECFRPQNPSSARDTVRAGRALAKAGADLIVFVGGDGTARDLFEAVGSDTPVLGIPAGVKMHSGVFATTPSDAGALLDELVAGGLVAASRAEVRDIDEDALRRGELGNRFYGEMRVPAAGGYLQHTKVGGRENEQLAVVEIVADLDERFASEQRPLIIGPGSTLAAFKRQLGLEPTLLGFDVVRNGSAQLVDADRIALDSLIGQSPILLLSFSRVQGFLVGRGNQQVSSRLLASLAPADLVAVGSRSKLATLDGRPLLIDSGDPVVDAQWAGLIELTAGFEDRLFYRVSSSLAPASGVA